MRFAARCGVQDAARAAACDAVLERIATEHVEQVRVAWADLHGTQRGKTLVCGFDASPVSRAFDAGVGMVSTLLLKDTSDRTAFKVFEPGAAGLPPGFGAANNVILLPDPATYVALPWAPGTGWMRAEPWFEDGTPVVADPRRVLQRALAVLAAAGLGLRCGLEVEFHIFRITGERLAPEDAAWPAEPPAVALLHPGYQLLSESWADLCDEPLAIVRRTALALGLPLPLEIELGPSQFEAVFGPTDALTAADQMVLFRNGVRQALRRAGYHASFVCRPPFEGAVASGWHLHHSLVDAQRRQRDVPPVAGRRRRQRAPVAQRPGAHWLAGLLAHAPGMAALCAPTIGAYSRFRGSVMAPQAALWGRDNRGAMLRVVGAPGDATRASRTAWASRWPTPTWRWRHRFGRGSTAWRGGSSPGRPPSTLCRRCGPAAGNAGRRAGRAGRRRRAAAGPGRTHGAGLPRHQAAGTGPPRAGRRRRRMGAA